MKYASLTHHIIRETGTQRGLETFFLLLVELTVCYIFSLAMNNLNHQKDENNEGSEVHLLYYFN